MASKYQYKGLRPPPLEQDAPSGAKLGAKIEATFTRFIQKVVTWGWEFAADLLVDIADNVFRILQPGMTRMTKPLFDNIRNQAGTPAYIKTTLDAIEAETGESKFFGQLVKFLAFAFGLAFGGMSPAGRAWSYSIDGELRTGRPSVIELIELLKRGNLDRQAFERYCMDLGVPDDIRNGLLEMYDTRGQVNDLIFGYMRGLYTEDGLRARMVTAGIPREMHEIYIEQAKVIPPVPDLIRMMVREAFNEDTVNRFGHDDDYPADINQYLSKLGLSAEWGKAYWRSHWQLPSPNQVFEMLHRGLITKDDVNVFLKTADYAPYWRDKMEGISYNIMTRVDLRRLYQAGLIDRDYVYNNYLKMGYEPTDAEKLTEFAELGATLDEKDLTKADIIGLYVDGLQDRGATSADLVKMGYDNEEAEDLLLRADFDIQKAAKTDAINYIEERFLAGKLDRSAAGSELSLAGLSTVAVERRLMEFERAKERARSIPTNAEGRKLFVAGAISEQDYRDLLALRNYDAKYIEWFVKDAKGAIEPPEGAGNA